MWSRQVQALVLPVVLAGSLALSPGHARAGEPPDVKQLVAGLVNVVIDIHDINIFVNDVDVQDLVVVDVRDVLSDDDINLLSELIKGNEIASRNQNFLNYILTYAQILDGSQTVVGLLSDQDILYVLGSD